MKRFLYFLFMTEVLISCGNKKSKAEGCDVTSNDSAAVMDIDDAEFFSFFGQHLHKKRPMMPQIEKIASEVGGVSIEGNVMTIGDVSWGINIHTDDISLLTSTQPDSPEMESVKRIITRYYGEPYEEYGTDLKWSSDSYSDLEYDFLPCGTLVRMCQLYTEKGGTVLIFD